MHRLRWSLLILATAAVTVFAAPSALTGRLFVTDDPIPTGWENPVAMAQRALHDQIGGLYGLRFAGLGCRAGVTVVWFDMLGPFAPGRAAVAKSLNPWDNSDPRWTGSMLDAMAGAAAFRGPDDAPCKP